MPTVQCRFRPLPPLRRMLAVATCAACVVLSVAPAAQASVPPWTDAPFTYYADNISLARVLQDFAGSFSLSLELSPQLAGKVNGRFNSQTPTEFIDRLGGVYGFTWFTHAGTLFVSRTNEMATKGISASGGSITGMRSALTSLGVLDKRFGWGELPEQGVALVSGPPAYVALVERTVASLPLVAGGQQVTVFRLKHASVDDRTILYRDRQITTPGLAQVLRNLVSGSGSTAGVSNELLSSVAPLRTAAGLTSAANVGGVPFDSASSGGASGPVASPNGSAGGGTLPANAASGEGNPSQTNRVADSNGQRRRAPSIQADSRLNALIVQDIPERMPIYRKLIDQLDVPTALIEIEALIIDVNSTRLDELGIAWGGRKGGTIAGFGNLTASSDGNDLTIGAINRNVYVDPTSLVVNAGNFLVSRIRALEGIGEARIQARPSILTVDNIGALLDLSETFYVRSTGERVATVTPITAGTTLRVTPHYVERPGMGSVIQLDVDIEDGQIQETRVDQIPIVRRSVISTQAIVAENQTLLVGGYNTQQNTSQLNRVPILGSIPVLGTFFSNRTTNVQSRERLFLIKPRIVTLPNTPVAASQPVLVPADPDALVSSPLTVPPMTGEDSGMLLRAPPGPLQPTLAPLPATVTFPSTGEN